jgi:hypothetical protein
MCHIWMMLFTAPPAHVQGVDTTLKRTGHYKYVPLVDSPLPFAATGAKVTAERVVKQWLKNAWNASELTDSLILAQLPQCSGDDLLLLYQPFDEGASASTVHGQLQFHFRVQDSDKCTLCIDDRA